MLLHRRACPQAALHAGGLRECGRMPAGRPLPYSAIPLARGQNAHRRVGIRLGITPMRVFERVRCADSRKWVATVRGNCTS